MNNSDRFTYITIIIGFLLIGISLFLTSWEPELLVSYSLFWILMIGYRLVKVRLPQGLYMTFTPLLIFVGMFLLGPAPMAIILVLGILSTRLFGIYMRSAVFNTSQFVISMYAGYVAFSWVGGIVPLTYLNGTIFWKMLISTWVFMVVNILLVYTSDLLSNSYKIQKFIRNMYWEIVIWGLSFPLSVLVLFYKFRFHLDLMEIILALGILLVFCYLIQRIVDNFVIGIRLSQLTDFITELSAPLKQTEILDSLFSGLDSVVDYHCCAVWEKTPEEGFSLLEHRSVLPQLDPIFSPEIFQKAIDKGFIRGRFTTTNRSWGPLFQPLPTRYLLAPMIYGGEIRGVLHVEEQKSYLYTETDQKLISLVAENLAVALEHARTVQELESTQEYLLNILTNSHIAIIVTDEHNRAQIFNEGATQLSGYQENEMLGSPISRCFHPDDYRKIRRLLIRKGKIEDWETEIITAHGELLPISLSASMLRDDLGGVVGVVAVAYNIAQRKLLQKQLVQNEKLAALGQLITGVTHEINNRLQPILGFTQLLKRSALSDDQRDPVMAIEKSAQGARAIVQSLLHFARPGEANLQPGNLNKTIQNALQLLEIDPSKVSIAMQLDPDLPVTLYDSHQIEQVMLNLLKNALQALESKGGKIWIKTDSENQKVWVRVRDDGPGMTEKIRSRVFDPFFSTKTVGHGVGLGLSLCYGIIQSHGGSIQIQSRPSRGTEVSFGIPLQKCPLPEVPDPIPSPEVSGQPIIAGGKIFVVDDEEGIRNLLQDILSEFYEVKIFENGQTAMEAMKEEEFDLCLCDLRMPDVDGIDLYHWVCQYLSGHKGDFIFITGDTFGPAAQSFLESVQLKYLCKPFTVQQIESAVREHFQLHPPKCSIAE